MEDPDPAGYESQIIEDKDSSVTVRPIESKNREDDEGNDEEVNVKFDAHTESMDLPEVEERNNNVSEGDVKETSDNRMHSSEIIGDSVSLENDSKQKSTFEIPEQQRKSSAISDDIQLKAMQGESTERSDELSPQSNIQTLAQKSQIETDTTPTKKLLDPSSNVSDFDRDAVQVKPTRVNAASKSESKIKLMAAEILEKSASTTYPPVLSKSKPVERSSSKVESLKSKLITTATLETKTPGVKDADGSELGRVRVIEGPTGHMKEMKARIERSMSDATRPRVPPVRRVKAADGEGIQESEQEGLRAEEKRRLKSEEWMKKLSESHDHSAASKISGTPSRTSPLAPPSGDPQGTSSPAAGDRHRVASRWEERVRAETEAQQARVLEEKRKRAEANRIAAEQSAGKSLETGLTPYKPEQKAVHVPPSVSSKLHVSAQKTAATKSNDVISLADTKSTKQPISPKLTSPVTIQSDRTDGASLTSKQRVVESKLAPLDLDSCDRDGLKKKIHELYEIVRRLEGEKSELKKLLASHDIPFPASKTPNRPASPSTTHYPSNEEEESTNGDSNAANNNLREPSPLNGSSHDQVPGISHHDVTATPITSADQPVRGSDHDVIDTPTADLDDDRVLV